ncbi:GM17709, partial [Drosophila sechellia]
WSTNVSQLSRGDNQNKPLVAGPPQHICLDGCREEIPIRHLAEPTSHLSGRSMRTTTVPLSAFTHISSSCRRPQECPVWSGATGREGLIVNNATRMIT